jgi:hypothetical protein
MFTVITGPPCSGKSTYARGRAQPGDIVIDYDVLAVALTGPGADSHDHAPAVAEVTHAARAAAIEVALRLARQVDVYLIDSQPSARRLSDYRAAGANVVTLDPGRDEVVQRVREQRPP